jgi:hypothetical protein
VRIPLLNWMTRRAPKPYSLRDALVETESPPGRAMSGKYLLLYKYLEGRYANRVVLTFAEIEDLLGFALPGQARLHPEWWTDSTLNVAEASYSDSWVLADRTAVPNMVAQTVVFERG